ncbi:MAG: DMT family transporter, partial [Kiritimatiellae bacterium]|nr:DMT family transporter [Kiritimatiellia bacterium]
MPTAGILFGLGAAALQSIAYLCSRWFVTRGGGGARRLLALSHIQMGVAAALLLPLLWPADMPPPGRFALGLVAATAFYLLAQAALFRTLKTVDASRISPMLGLKIVIVAVLSALFMGATLSFRQWLAVAMSFAGVWLLRQAGARVPWKCVFVVLGACFFYCMSDIYIAKLVKDLAPLPTFRASLVGVCMSYALSGLFGLALWLWTRRAAPTPLQAPNPTVPQSHGPTAPQSHGPTVPQSHGPTVPQS